MQERVFLPQQGSSLARRVYQRIKEDLLEFQLLPGDRFTETEVAARVQASRTPVREALMRLEREGYLQMKTRAGWQVKPFDFRLFQELYDLRSILEQASLRRLEEVKTIPSIKLLTATWLVSPLDRLRDGQKLFGEDEVFHHTLVQAAGNSEVTRIHQEITERIRIVRRLDFTNPDRLSATYDEHGAILEALMAGRRDEACSILEAHIASSCATVETITLAKMETARSLRYEI
ncbi:MAG: GntR family transcriptional regulator [Spirochaetales bacterium]|nr:GntR family transcriptional regulator [Spirochaetales bacterium]